MKKSILLAITMFLSLEGSSQPPFYWSQTADTNIALSLTKMICDSHGNIYSIGRHFTNPSAYSGLAKFDQFGNYLWQQIDSGPMNYAYEMDLTHDSNGDIYTCGYINDITGLQTAYLSKYDESGNLLWQKLYPGPNGKKTLFDSFTYFNSTIFLAGYVSDAQNNSQCLIQSYDTLGNLIWSHTDSLMNVNPDAAYYITHDSQDLLITGLTDHVSITFRMFLTKYDISGSKVWQTIDNFPSYENFGTKIAVDGNDNIYVGMNYGTSHDVAKYNSAGNYQWGYSISPSLPTSPPAVFDLKTDSLNNLYLSGNCSIPGGIDGLDAFVFTKLDQNGNVIYNVPGQFQGWGRSFDFYPPNDIVVIGSLDSLGERLIDIDNNGNISWTHFYTNDVPYFFGETHMIVDAMHNILVGGFSAVGSSPMTVIKYGNNLFSQIDEISAEQNRFYPNPVSDKLFIGKEHGSTSLIRIFNLSGSLVREMSNIREDIIDLHSLTPGTYLIEVISEKEISRDIIVKI